MDEIYTRSPDLADQWENYVGSTRDILAGHYELEVTNWRGHRVMVTVTNRAGEPRHRGSWAGSAELGGEDQVSWRELAVLDLACDEDDPVRDRAVGCPARQRAGRLGG